MNASEEITAARDDLKRAHERLQRLTEQLPADAPGSVQRWIRELRALGADIDRWLTGRAGH
jgi:hypothetical protein